VIHSLRRNDVHLEFRRRLLDGETLFGTMVTLPCPAVAEILAQVGFDWLFIDGEHGPLETTQIQSLLQAAGPDVACLVRVPAADETAIKKALDLGAAGVIVPQVNSAETAERVVRWSKYAPQGTRGVGLARAHGYGMRFGDYIQSANEGVTVVVQAEHADAVARIDEIAAVPGVDAVLLGPYDLAASLGLSGQIEHPRVREAIDRVTDACLRAGRPLGMFGVTADAVKPYRDRGYTLLIGSVDTLLLGRAAGEMLKQLKG
jgi:2-keto-3-deoxy-L-rhamnonate aldolase RhmA